MLIASFSSCSTAKAKKDAPALRPASLSFVELASFFPKDTIAVGRFRIDKFDETWFPLFSEKTGDPEMDALMKKRNLEFRALLKAESLELFGMDISTAKEIVFAMNGDGGVLAVQGNGIAQQPKSQKMLEVFHTRVIGNTVLFYPKSSAEAVIQNEGLDVSKLKAIPGNSPLVIHIPAL